jgi:endoglucanase
MATVAVLSSWPGGYQAGLTVMNHGATVNPWSVTFDLPSGVRLESAWNAGYTSEATATGTRVTATAPSWNPDLATDESVTLGFVANGPVTPPPSAVTLSGTPCVNTSA